MFYTIGAVIFCTNFYFRETSKLSGEVSDQKCLSPLLYEKGSTLKGRLLLNGTWKGGEW